MDGEQCSSNVTIGASGFFFSTKKHDEPEHKIVLSRYSHIRTDEKTHGGKQSAAKHVGPTSIVKFSPLVTNIRRDKDRKIPVSVSYAATPQEIYVNFTEEDRDFAKFQQDLQSQMRKEEKNHSSVREIFAGEITSLF